MPRLQTRHLPCVQTTFYGEQLLCITSPLYYPVCGGFLAAHNPFLHQYCFLCQANVIHLVIWYASWMVDCQVLYATSAHDNCAKNFVPTGKNGCNPTTLYFFHTCICKAKTQYLMYGLHRRAPSCWQHLCRDSYHTVPCLRYKFCSCLLV